MSNNPGGAFMVWWSGVLMRVKLARYLLPIALIVWLALTALTFRFLLYPEAQYTKTYLAALFCPRHSVSYFNTSDRQLYTFTPAQNFLDGFEQFWPDVRWKMLIGMSTTFILSFVGTFNIGFAIFKKMDDKQCSPQWIRGAKLIPVDELNRQMDKANEERDIRIGETRLPIKAEQQGVFMCGAAGSGKTQILSSAVSSIRKRHGMKGIIYGYKADDYFMKFYDAGRDILFSPIDERGIKWNIFREINEATAVFDIAAIAGSLIPTPAKAGENAWVYNDARTVFEAMLTYLYTNNLQTMSDLWSMLTLETSALVEMLKGKPGCEAGYKLISNASGRTTDTILGAVVEHTKFFQFMAAYDSDFSTNKWLNDGKPGFIFLQNSPVAKDLLRPILTLFIDMLSRRIIDLPDDYKRRIFFMIDEFGTLNKLESLIELIARGRSKGVSIWLATQDFGQVDSKYGDNLRSTINNSISTKIVLMCPDAVTAKQMSDLIGPCEVVEVSSSVQGGPQGMFGDRQTRTEHRNTKPLVLSSTIQAMKPLTAYVKFPAYDWTLTDIPYVNYPNVAEGLIPSESVRIGGRQD
jgi:hypothetical protein